jgi:hypothetical protein
MGHPDLDLLVKGDLVLPKRLPEVRQSGSELGSSPDLCPGRALRQKGLDFQGHFIFPESWTPTSIPTASRDGRFSPLFHLGRSRGVTTFIEMPTMPGPHRASTSFRKKIDLVNQLAKVDIALLATLKKEGTPGLIPPLVNWGPAALNSLSSRRT